LKCRSTKISLLFLKLLSTHWKLKRKKHAICPYKEHFLEHYSF
jgi:hypothetical protein